MQNKELAAGLHKSIIKNFDQRKVHLSFVDNMWDADLADMQFFYALLIFKVNMFGLLL